MTTSKHLNILILRLLLALMLLSLALTGCIATPRTRAVVQDTKAGYRLGLTVDEDLRVVAIDAESAAVQAGVEVGDQLVDLTWILSEAPEDLASAAKDTVSEGTVSAVVTAAVTNTVTPLRPPPGVEHETVPFTAPDDIRAMISYGLPLRLQIVRDGVVQMLTIIPAPQSDAGDAPATHERYF